MRDTQADTPDAQSASMGYMNGGFWGRLKLAKKPVASKRPSTPAPEPEAEPDFDVDSDADALHSCCICGALLGFDREDEINGEGWGRDICGDCNRTKNDEALFGR
jgi:hypothetical protein